jgi:transcriptional regulator of acetoin/glycerol metabolism
VDLRVIAASQEPISALVACGDLRPDLQARLEGYSVGLWRMSDRAVDLGIIIAALIESAGVEPPVLRGSVARLLFRYEWPLNIRELEQTLNRAIALAGGGPIGATHLPETIRQPRTVDGSVPARFQSSRPSAATDDDLRGALVELLEKHRGNITEVANAMGKARMQIHRWLQRFNIDPGSFRSQ